MEELDDVLNGTTPEPEPQPEITPEPESEPTPEPEPQKGNEPPDARELEGFRKAYFAEKEKRQQYEAHLRELQRQQEEQAKPDFWEAPEQHIGQLKSEFEQIRTNDRIAMSEMFAESKYEDFHEKVGVFQQLATQFPGLVDQMRSDRNPAEFAYRTALNYQKVQEMGNPEEYEKKLESKLRDKIQKEYEAKLNAELEKRNIPASLADARGTGTKTAPEWGGPIPLSDVLK